MPHHTPTRLTLLTTLCLILLLGCAAPAPPAETRLTLPEPAPVALGDRPLRVVASTTIIGDVVRQVGQDDIELVVLLAPGQDPHSFEPAPADLAAVERADVLFVNGWGLEAGLLKGLDARTQERVVAVSAEITPITLTSDDDAPEDDAHADEHDEDHEDDHGEIDPHVWLAVANVRQWTDNVARVLGALDPARADAYRARADAYRAELDVLDAAVRAELGTVSAERRKLVTNHDALGYLADAYGYTVVGTVIPALSTGSEPSAGDLAELVQTMAAQGVCTLFAESTVNARLAQTVAAELRGCDAVSVVALYTGSLGPPDSDAATYIDMMRFNAAAIAGALR